MKDIRKNEIKWTGILLVILTICATVILFYAASQFGKMVAEYM